MSLPDKSKKKNALNGYLMFLIFSSVKHFDINVIKSCGQTITHLECIIYLWNCTREADMRIMSSMYA